MNRKYLKSLFLGGLLLVMACNSDYESTFGFDPFVEFKTPTVKISENAGPTATVTVGYVGPELKEAVTVTFDVALTGPGDDVTLPGNTVTIPAGAYTATTVVTFDNNFINDGDKVITLTLQETSASNIGLATNGTGRSKSVVTIVDDDCPFDIADYVGNYDVTMELEFGFIFAAGTYEGLTATLTAGAGENTLVDPDFGYLSLSARAAVPVEIEINPTEATTKINGSDQLYTDGMTYESVYAYGTAPARRFFTNDDLGVGSLASCNKQFTVRALIRREDGTIGQRLILTYTKL